MYAISSSKVLVCLGQLRSVLLSSKQKLFLNLLIYFLQEKFIFKKKEQRNKFQHMRIEQIS